jgi:hypothetical protein
MTKFRCNYELDQRADLELVNLTQAIYRAIPRALEGKANIALDDDGLPDAGQYYLLYVASLIYGAADAALTLTLHNLGREARILERQVFECLVRAAYYAANPEEAKLALLSTAHQEMKLLDQLGYSTDAERYRRVRKVANEVDAQHKFARAYREPQLRDILSAPGNEGLQRMYALNYRVSSLMAHASFNGAGAIMKEEGLSFDSREELVNFGIASVTVCLLAFMELINLHLKLGIDEQIETFKEQWQQVERSMA